MPCARVCRVHACAAMGTRAYRPGRNSSYIVRLLGYAERISPPLPAPRISPVPSLDLASWGLALGLRWELTKGSGVASMVRARWLRLMALVQGRSPPRNDTVVKATGLATSEYLDMPGPGAIKHDPQPTASGGAHLWGAGHSPLCWKL